MTRFQKFATVLVAGFGLLMLQSIAAAQSSDEKGPDQGMRVGTFDSRALALAYYRSKEFNTQMAAMHAEHEKAKAAGDDKRVKELEAEGPAQQDLAHKQGFGSWPVDNILEKIKGTIPEIAAQANVQVIVSKWDIVYQQADVKFIDVTDLMVKPFDPDEATLKLIQDIQKQKPVPLDQLKDHQH